MIWQVYKENVTTARNFNLSCAWLLCYGCQHLKTFFFLSFLLPNVNCQPTVIQSFVRNLWNHFLPLLYAKWVGNRLVAIGSCLEAQFVEGANKKGLSNLFLLLQGSRWELHRHLEQPFPWRVNVDFIFLTIQNEVDRPFLSFQLN